MDIRNISTTLASLGVKVPETPLKEEIIRFLTETKSERIVEIPIVLSNIPNNSPLRILDIGCRYSIVSIQLASLGHKIDGIDINGYNHTHPNFHFKKRDIQKSGYKSATFDIAISLSTIEHIGLGRYGDSIDTEADVKVIQEISRILKPKGKLLLTIPFGKRCITPWYRVYNIERVKELFQQNKLAIRQQNFFKETTKGVWIPVSLKEASEVDSSSYARAVAFFEAVKTT